MRIGMITGEYPPMEGGVGAFTRELAGALVDSGHDLHILTDRRATPADDARFHISAAVTGWNRASLAAVAGWAKSARLDVVNIQYETAAFQMAALVHFLPALLGSIPVVTTFHDLLTPYLFPKAGPLRWKTLMVLARRSRGIIVTNAQDERQISVERGLPPLVNIPIGSNIKPASRIGYNRAAWRARLGLSESAIAVGYFGFMNASKGVDTLVEAVGQVTAQGLDAHLILIGGRTGTSDPTNAAFADEIEQLARKNGIADRLHWTGFVSEAEVSGYLYACDMLALPFKDGVSYRRGSFMAGLAHACAIITTRPTVELAELEDHVNVMLVAPNGPAELAAAMNKLASDSDLRERLGQAAQTLSGRFTWENIAADTLSFYRKVTGGRAS